MKPSCGPKADAPGRVPRNSGGAALAAARALSLLVWALGAGCVITLDGLPGTDAGSSSDASGPVGSSSADANVDGTTDGVSSTGGWVNVTGSLAELASECGTMQSVFVKPDEGLLIAGIAGDGLWASRNGGASWQPLDTGNAATCGPEPGYVVDAGDEEILVSQDSGEFDAAVAADASSQSPTTACITNRPTSLVLDPTASTRYWESGIYGPGVYVTTNDGNTFNELGTVTHCDLVSVDFSDPNRQTLLAGGHEESQTLYLSTDGGTTWSNVGAGLPEDTNCTFPLVLDATHYLVGCGGYGGGPSGVWGTSDGGMTWTMMTSLGGAGAPLVASDASIYWASPNGGGLTRSTDRGTSWGPAMGAGFASVTPVELPDGRIATLGPESIMVSADHGMSWAPVGAGLPYPDAVGLVYLSGSFYVWHQSCGFGGPVAVPTDAIEKYPFSDEDD